MLSPGTRLAQYEILGSIGAGGMGEVYRARDARLDREVAIKVLPEATEGNAEMRLRFEREARAIAALSHPNILAIHELAVVEGRPVAVVELVEGESLRARLARGPMSWRAMKAWAGETRISRQSRASRKHLRPAAMWHCAKRRKTERQNVAPSSSTASRRSSPWRRWSMSIARVTTATTRTRALPTNWTI